MIRIRRMDVDEIGKLREINRSEVIRVGYRQEGTELIEMAVHWDTPPWFDGDGEHSFGEMIGMAEHYLDLGGTAIGAFDDNRLAGFAVYRPRLRPTMGQLAILHVSDGYRRSGIASRLHAQVLALARSDGATALYVSATPSESAVGFYLSKGFVPTSEPVPELLAEEPEDIHMVLQL